MRIFIKILLSSFIIVLIQSCSEDTLNENGKGTLTGTVVKKGENTPLEDVKITTSPVSTTVFTDENGFFIINNITSGDYSVQAEKDSFLSSFEAANIIDGQASNVVFELDVSTANNRPPTEPILITPADNSVDVALDVDFIWSSSDPDEDPITYSIELRNGTNEEVLLFENIEDTIYSIENLRLGETYFWQVTASDDINPPVISNLSSFNTIAEVFNRFFYVRKVGNNNIIFSGSDEGDEESNNYEFQLTDLDKNSFRPRKNIINNKIAFLRTDGSETHIYTMNTNGSDVTKITSTIPVSGFRSDELDFTWYQNGQRIYYPYLNKLYSINANGTGNTLVYQASEGTFITEVATNDFNNLILLKTNNSEGYEARIFAVTTSGSEQFVVVEGLTGALGGIDFSIDGSKVLYTRDVSGFENQEYRQLDSRIFEYNNDLGTTLEIDTFKPEGANDLDVKYSPDNGVIIFMSTSNDGVSQKNIYKHVFDESLEDRQLIFTNAFMPDWK
tara:strand:+ start:26216 stop:27724 length:1509 start_codon:yes stop_codon:yes gene_type:complete